MPRSSFFFFSREASCCEHFRFHSTSFLFYFILLLSFIFVAHRGAHRWSRVVVRVVCSPRLRSSIRHKCRPRSPPPMPSVCPFFIHPRPFFVSVCLCFILLFYDLHITYYSPFIGFFFYRLPPRKDAEHSQQHLRLKVALRLVGLCALLIIQNR